MALSRLVFSQICFCFSFKFIYMLALIRRCLLVTTVRCFVLYLVFFSFCNFMYLIEKTISRKKQKQQKKPWITDYILKLISEKNTLYSHFLQTGNIEILKQYRTARNNINHKIRKSRYIYYKNYFFSCKKNIKKFWKGVNLITNCKQTKDDSPKLIISSGKSYDNPKDIATQLNTYFANVAPSLINKLNKQQTKKDFSLYLKNSVEPSFYLTPVTPTEVEDILDSLDDKKASDIYEFPVRIIKQIKSIIKAPLSVIFNESFSSGVFPDELKYAKVTPLHKGKSKLEVNNYRPISVLPIFDKILEKIMYKRLINFLEKHKVLSSCQYGFRQNCSTSLALHDLISKITKSLESEELSCVIFLDFAKAFDTVNHDILLSKLKHYGVRGIPLKWFTSYLNNRMQSVSVG